MANAHVVESLPDEPELSTGVCVELEQEPRKTSSSVDSHRRSSFFGSGSTPSLWLAGPAPAQRA